MSTSLPCPLQILAIDDDPVDLESLERLLKQATRFTTKLSKATSLKQACLQLDEQPFDLVLLDLNLPGSQGLETLSQMLQDAYDVPIVVLTGADERELGEQAISRGAADYLSKGKLSTELLEKTLLFARERFSREQTVLEQQTRLFAALTDQQIRIASNLHDGVLQQQTALGIKLDEIYRELVEEQSSQARELASLLDLMDEVRDTLRAAVKDVAPPKLTNEGLPAALEHLARQIPSTGPTSCQFESPTGLAVPDMRIALQLYYVAQEALNNALKHADATEIKLVLASTPRDLVLQVNDNGQGFNLDDLRDEQCGWGLQSMRNRARLIGARLTVHSKLGQGTIVRCGIPHARLPA